MPGTWNARGSRLRRWRGHYSGRRKCWRLTTEALQDFAHLRLIVVRGLKLGYTASTVVAGVVTSDVSPPGTTLLARRTIPSLLRSLKGNATPRAQCRWHASSPTPPTIPWNFPCSCARAGFTWRPFLREKFPRPLQTLRCDWKNALQKMW